MFCFVKNKGIFVKINGIMKRFTNFHSLNVFSLHLDVWEYEWHTHNFYEVIFIEQGTGMHLLNGLRFEYNTGDIFLLTPEDAHAFEIQSTTIFTFVKFTEQLFFELIDNPHAKEAVNSIKNAILNTNNRLGSVVASSTDSKYLFDLLKVLQYEFRNDAPYQYAIALSVFKSMMLYLARHRNESALLLSNANDRLQAVLSYIRLHALDAEKMKINTLAATFHLSPNYISAYIKNHTGLSLQHYVIQIKLKQAEQLLLQNNFTVGEIASRLGFNDASHFNKLFKKYKGVAPTAFRESDKQ